MNPVTHTSHLGFGWPSSVLWGFPFSKVRKGCKFAIMAKAKKKRASKYDEKLAINASFEDVIKISVAGNPAPKPKSVKPAKKSTKK